eukprot:11194718-Lingulodinium_polyedra.AAC.1
MRSRPVRIKPLRPNVGMARGPRPRLQQTLPLDPAAGNGNTDKNAAPILGPLARCQTAPWA